MNPALRQYLDDLRAFPRFAEATPITVNSNDGLRNTPLHYAVIQGREEVVAWLLDEAADPNAPGKYEFTPVHEAVLFGHERIVALLLARGGNPALKCQMGDAFELAAVEENAATLALLKHPQTSRHDQLGPWAGWLILKSRQAGPPYDRN